MWLAPGAVTVNVTAIMNALDVSTVGNCLGVAIIWYGPNMQPNHAASCTWKSGLIALLQGGYGNNPPGLTMEVPSGVTGFAGQIISPKTLDVGLSMAMFDINGNDLPLFAPSGSGVTVLTPVWPFL